MIFILMVLQAAVMYWENAVGQIILVVLFLLGAALQYKTWKPMAFQIYRKLAALKGNKI